MHIAADLDVSIDGTAFHVGGDGAVIRVQTADGSDLMAALRDGGQVSRRRLAEFAQQVADRGLSVELHDLRGKIFTLGAEANSGPLRVLTGTRHVAPASFRASLQLVRIAVGRRAVFFTGAAVLGATVAVALRFLATSARSQRAVANACSRDTAR